MLHLVHVPWVEAGGQWIEVVVRESSRVRQPRVVAHPDGAVEVVVPPRTSLRTVDRLLAHNQDWVAKQVRWSHARKLGLQRPDVVWLHGQPLPLPEVRSIEAWYRARARGAIAAATAREAERLGLEYASVAIRDQRTRWGSCSSRGNLSFNWRLVLAPIDVLDYVVVHELCHLVEHNHSQAYWDLVGRSRPGFEAEKRWLEEHGPELLAYRPPELLSAAA